MAQDIILTWYEIALLVLAPMASMALIFWLVGRTPRPRPYHPQRHHYDDCH